MKRVKTLFFFSGMLLSLAAKSFCNEELTIDLFIPKYALTGATKASAEMPCALPADPVALLNEIIDPKTQKPIRILFVNNLNPQTGDGSFNNPFNTLDGAELASSPNDIIYVYRGDGTSKGMEGGIVLKDFQHLLSSNHSYEFETRYGTFYLPAATREAAVLTNHNGNAVELANQNEVHGFIIESSRGWGIHGSGVCEGQIRHTTIISGSKLEGAIGLENVQGHFEIAENTIKGSATPSVNGIDIRNHGSSMANFDIQGNQITHFSEGIVLYTFDHSIAVSHIEFNTIGTCSKSDVELKAFDHSELCSL